MKLPLETNNGIIRDSGDKVVAGVNPFEGAAFIVKAVNEREGLIELLQKIADAADLIPLAEIPTPLFNLIENQVRTALNQAEKE